MCIWLRHWLRPFLHQFWMLTGWLASTTLVIWSSGYTCRQHYSPPLWWLKDRVIFPSVINFSRSTQHTRSVIYSVYFEARCITLSFLVWLSSLCPINKVLISMQLNFPSNSQLVIKSILATMSPREIWDFVGKKNKHQNNIIAPDQLPQGVIFLKSRICVFFQSEIQAFSNFFSSTVLR